jgi:hypothetical protein
MHAVCSVCVLHAVCCMQCVVCGVLCVLLAVCDARVCVLHVAMNRMTGEKVDLSRARAASESVDNISMEVKTNNA